MKRMRLFCLWPRDRAPWLWWVWLGLAGCAEDPVESGADASARPDARAADAARIDAGREAASEASLPAIDANTARPDEGHAGRPEARAPDGAADSQPELADAASDGACRAACRESTSSCREGLLTHCVPEGGCLQEVSTACTSGQCFDSEQCGYTVGGEIEGASGGLALAFDDGDAHAVQGDGPFVLPTPVADGASFDVVVREHPAGQRCALHDAKGRIQGASFFDVQVRCEGGPREALSAITYLKSITSRHLDGFGTVVAAADDGFTWAVGVPGDDSSGRGINPPERDNGATDSGAVLVFSSDAAGDWSVTFIKEPVPGERNAFGSAVALRGDTLVVGAPNTSPAFRTGSVYVYVRQGTVWRQQAQLVAAHPDAKDAFGTSVALTGVGAWRSAPENGDTLVVGAPYDDGNATGAETDNSVTDAGAAYVFVREGTVWRQQAFLKAADARPGQHFGTTVDASGDVVVVGAPTDAFDVDERAAGAGVYLFGRRADAWEPMQVLAGSEGVWQFGRTLSLSGDLLVVDSVSDRADGVWTDLVDTFIRKGAGLFEPVGQPLSSGAPQLDATDASTLAVRGTMLALGVPSAPSATTGGIDTSNADPTLPEAGAVRLYDWKEPEGWVLRHAVRAPSPGPGDRFGSSVALGPTSLLIGAPREDSNATGVDGAADDEVAYGTSYDSGAVYVVR